VTSQFGLLPLSSDKRGSRTSFESLPVAFAALLFVAVQAPT